MSAKWMLTLTSLCEQSGVGVATLSNSMLLYMLTYKASPSYGDYRRLMFSYTIVEMVYSFLSFTSGMKAHSTDTSFVVFNFYHGYVSRSIAPLFLIDFCGIYFTLILILVLHFIYRYFVVCDAGKLENFKGWYLMLWVVGSTISGFSMAYLKYWTFPEREHLTNELREDFLQYFALTMEEIVYNGPNYYVCKKFNDCKKPRADWITMFILCGGLIFSVSTMCFCGYSCCKKLGEHKNRLSSRTANLQKQLMAALIIQSVIPIIFMYIPVFLLFMTPMFRVGFGPYDNIAMATLAIYPPVDQFIIIYVIEDFRTAVKDLFKCGKMQESAPSN
ncbi:Serpentine receptor class r-10 [Caenorhabditis elegans]|uniref:Serpentine receptor class r-10 n=1 Tax=Caenorhabditis elegans TaxID=6239 RepID=Q9GUE1_CAEEL|nr:Seven TM Receptor [Caenorhabditis elegans]CCD72145.1 Seven TM Receptor [Caenorhabditis elegans]|eukprot:NP_505322.1 Seven TM Receptor [Caenorhabditis elegans]